MLQRVQQSTRSNFSELLLPTGASQTRNSEAATLLNAPAISNIQPNTS
jgi:hypothetical protein